MIKKRNYEFAVYTALLMLAVVGINLLVKGPFLLSSALILDDLPHFPGSLFADLESRNLYFWVFSKINQIFENPGAARLTYLIMMATSAIALFWFLMLWGTDKLTAFVLAFVAIMAPSNAVMIAFLNGSYSILFFFAYSIGLLAMSACCTLRNLKPVTQWLLFFIGVLLVFLSSFFGTNSALLPLAVFFLPWFATQAYKHAQRRFLMMALFATPLLLLASSLAVIRVFSHPYTQMDGRLVFELHHLLYNAFILVTNAFKSFYAPMTNTGVLYTNIASLLETALISILFSVAVAFGLWRLRLAVKRHQAGLTFNVEDRASVLIPFFVVASVLSIGPLVPNTRLHMWHMYLPSLFLLGTLFLVLRIYMNKPAFLAIGAALIVSASYTLSKSSQPLNDSIEVHEALAKAVKSESGKWSPNDFLVIVLSDQPYLSGFNSYPKQRGLGFVRVHTGGNNYRGAYIAERRYLDAAFDLMAESVEGSLGVARLYYLNVKESQLEEQGQIMDLSSVVSPEEALKVCKHNTPRSLNFYGFLDEQLFRRHSEAVWKAEMKFQGDQQELFYLPEEKDWLFLEIEFKSQSSVVEDSNSSITSPPTPLLWRANGLQIWDLGKDMWKVHSGITNTTYNFQSSNFKASIAVIPECLMQIDVNGKKEILFGPFKTSGILQFGKGFNSRFWSGHQSVVVFAGRAG